MKRAAKSQITMLFILTIFVNLILVASAFAFSGGGHEEQHFTWKDWLWPIVNFAILFGVLFYFGRKPVREFLQKRTELIEKSIKEAEEAKALSRRTLDEVQAKLKNTDSEINKILENSKQAGEREKAALIAEGEHIKERIIEQAKSNIDFELEKAKKAIKTEAALMALELAEKQIKEKLGQKEQEGLFDEYIKKLEVKN
ncbi:MAG: F0F1 ATP synthase subunit B [Nitrospirae bacterium]|nr:F0F1 ATP synthase subunit B [Nitrospirota bacterium]